MESLQHFSVRGEVLRSLGITRLVFARWMPLDIKEAWEAANAFKRFSEWPCSIDLSCRRLQYSLQVWRWGKSLFCNRKACMILGGLPVSEWIPKSFLFKQTAMKPKESSLFIKQQKITNDFKYFFNLYHPYRRLFFLHISAGLLPKYYVSSHSSVCRWDRQ